MQAFWTTVCETCVACLCGICQCLMKMAFWCFCPCDSCMSVWLQNPGFCLAACSFIVFVEGKIWFSSRCLILGLGPLTKDTLWMEKQQRDEKPQAHSIVNTVKTLPQNNNNKASVCIPHTLLVCFLMCLISVVVVCPPGLNYHFKLTFQTVLGKFQAFSWSLCTKCTYLSLLRQ